MKLNLTATNKQEELVLAYLEENASETLANKINNGTPFEKDGKPLNNKKSLSSFMKYACDEARKLAEKGATSACIEDSVVYGWVIHYFEEDSIEGKLYTIDGEEYKPAPIVKKNTQRIPAPAISTNAVDKKPQVMQFSLFDIPSKETPTAQEESIAENTTPDWIVDEETGEILSDTSVNTAPPSQQASPLYQKYLQYATTTPNAVIVLRVGDFYEILGDYAVDIGNKLELTITSRECGLPERIPMIGFPYHSADTYIRKIRDFYNILVVDGDETKFLPYEENLQNEPPMYEDNDETDELEAELALQQFYDKDALCQLYELFRHNLEIQ